MATTSRPNIKQDVQRQRDQKRKQAREELQKRHPGIRDMIVEFQPDAVEIEQRSIPGGARWTLYTVFALIAAVCLWAYWAEVDRIVTAQGKLVVEQTIMIQPASTAPIRSMEVKFGEIVSAGQLLATLDPTFSDADVAQLRSQLESLNSHFQRLKAESLNVNFDIQGRESSLDWQTQYTAYLQRKREYAAKINEFASENAKLIVQRNNNIIELENQRDTLVTLNEVMEKYQRLAENRNVAETKLLDAELQLKQTQTQISTLQGKTGEFDADIASLATRKEAFEASWLAEIAKSMAEVSQNISKAEQELNKAVHAQEFVDISVPTNTPFSKFYVLEVADRTVGSVVQPGEPLFKLVPLEAPFELEIEVPGKDIGNIHLGDTVNIKLTSFPYQRHGYLTGVVRTISEGSFEKETAAGLPPISTYRSRVQLTNETSLTNTPENFRLLPGMIADAEIKVGTRRVYEYFLYPLIRSLGESIREP